MAEMEKLERAKRKKTVLRSLTTKLINRVETLITPPDIEIEERVMEDSRDIHEQLKEKIIKLKELDNEIGNLIDLESMELEVQTSEEYQEKVIKYKRKLFRHLNRKEKNIGNSNIPPTVGDMPYLIPFYLFKLKHSLFAPFSNVD